jgi:shikimate 5-dehydrogenase
VSDAIRGVRAMGFKGVNLTIPHKVEVMCHLDAITEKASPIRPVAPFCERPSRGALPASTDSACFVNQGTICFELWTEERAPAATMRAALEREFRAE